MHYRDFEECIECLNAHRVKYLIVGGYAVVFHARARATEDIDLLVEPSPANARRVKLALADFFGLDPSQLDAVDFTAPRTLFQIGVPPVRIDVFTSLLGLPEFAPLWKRRARGRFGAAPTQYLSKEDLIAAKEAAARPRDLADLEDLRGRREPQRRRRRKPTSSPRRG